MCAVRVRKRAHKEECNLYKNMFADATPTEHKTAPTAASCMIVCYLLTSIRVTTCAEKLKMTGNLESVWEKLDNCPKSMNFAERKFLSELLSFYFLAIIIMFSSTVC